MADADTSTTLKEATWLQRPFFDQCCDAIRLARMAEGYPTNSTDAGTLVRAAMINNMFAIEAAANCVLKCYPCSRSMQESLDKLGTLDKFEFLLGVRNSATTFDRGRKEIQGIQDLISLRNRYVHPKSRQHPMRFKQTDYKPPGIFEMEMDTPPTTPTLGIPLDHKYWKVEHAQGSIRATAAFLSCFFVELCRMTAKESTRFLSPEVIVDGQNLVMFNVEYRLDLEYARDNWNANIEFVDLSFNPDS